MTVLRSSTAVRYARTVSSTANSAECSRAGTAPTALASPTTSTLKLDRTALAATSAASTSSGVRLLAASVMPGTAGDQRVGHMKVAAADHPEDGVGPEVGKDGRDRVADEHQACSTRASARQGQIGR